MRGLTAYREWSAVSAEDKRGALEADFEEVALPLLDHIYRAACYLTKDKSQAEDLVQETYLRAFQYFDKFESGTNCKAWLLTILRNLYSNQYQQKRRRPEPVVWEEIEQTYESLVAEHERGEGSPETLLFSKVMDHEIEQALKELPEEYRTVIILVDIEELSYEEAVEAMACPVGTIRSRLSRGRRMLQVALRDYALEHGLIKKSTTEDSVTSMTSEKF